MRNTSVQSRIATLEKEVADLKAKMSALSSNGAPWWEHVKGAFAGDKAFQTAMRLGRAYRRSQKPTRRGR